MEEAVKGRRTSPYISTETQEDGSRVVRLHQDSSSGGGRTRLFQAEKLPRTVLSTINAQESPTAVLARQEMLNYASLIQGVSFRCLSETWRADRAKMQVIAKGKALAFLQPIAEKADPKRKYRDTEDRRYKACSA